MWVWIKNKENQEINWQISECLIEIDNVIKWKSLKIFSLVLK